MNDRTGTNWRKSSRSQGANNCVEVALTPHTTAIRDSKNPDAGHLTADSARWTAFLTALKNGTFEG